MRRFGFFVGAAILLSSSTAVSASTWQVEKQTEGFTNTQTVTAFVTSEHARFMLRCENKDRIMALFQPENVISGLALCLPDTESERIRPSRATTGSHFME